MINQTKKICSGVVNLKFGMDVNLYYGGLYDLRVIINGVRLRNGVGVLEL